MDWFQPKQLQLPKKKNSNKSYLDLLGDFTLRFQQKLGNYILGYDKTLSLDELEKLLQDSQISPIVLNKVADLGLQHELARLELKNTFYSLMLLRLLVSDSSALYDDRGRLILGRFLNFVRPYDPKSVALLFSYLNKLKKSIFAQKI